MKNFFKNLFGCTNVNTNLELQKAVETDDVKTAYKILINGAADVNMKIFFEVQEYVDSYDYTTKECTTCLLRTARSEAMKRLLRHFGALPLEELEKIWAAEKEKATRERKLKEEREQQEKKQRLAKKAEDDNRFLDEVLH